MDRKIYIASDHAGTKLKQYIINNLKIEELFFEDLGTNDEKPVDYPDYAKLVINKLENDTKNFGILICGTGIGMSISANRYSHIRAALCFNKEYAHLAREHNNANILVLGAKFLDFEDSLEIVKEFLMTSFSSGRHEIRLNKIKNFLSG